MQALGVFQQLNILQYPELFLAFVLAAFIFFKDKFGASKNNPTLFPLWLTAPCTVLIAGLPESYLAWLHKLQLWSGWRSNTAFGTLAAAKVYPVLLTLITGLFIPFWISCLLAAASFFIIDIVLFILSKKRKTRIRESLPQALDLMVLCVDAGLGLDSTISRIAQEETSVSQDLNAELLLLGRDILLGLDREKAYQDLYLRTGVDELKSLGASLNQAAQLGISVSKILRSQSEFLRSKLSQQAEEKAAKLPIYMAFPLWFCIMPALMVIVLAPSFITFMEYVNPLMFR